MTSESAESAYEPTEENRVKYRVKADSDDPIRRNEGAIQLAVVEREAKEFDRASRLLSSVEEEAGARLYAQARYIQGLVEIERGSPTEGAAQLELAVQVGHDDFSYRAILELARLLAQDATTVDRAIFWFQSLVEIPTGNWASRGFLNWGLFEFRRGNSVEARRLLLSSLARGVREKGGVPEKTERSAELHLGRIDHERGQVRSAMDWFHEAAMSSDRWVAEQARGRQAVILIETGRVDDAAELLREIVLGGGAEAANAAVGLAVILLERGEKREARRLAEVGSTSSDDEVRQRALDVLTRCGS